jgi:hypothetical protein
MTLLPIHIIAGLIGLVSGAVALYAYKGAKLHRKGGMIFVYAMMVVAITGTVMGALIYEMAAVIPGLLTFYLVLSSFLTVRHPVALQFPWIGFGVMLDRPAWSLHLPVHSVQRVGIRRRRNNSQRYHGF